MEFLLSKTVGEPMQQSESPLVHSPHGKVYEAGTLRYTFRGVAVLFLWLLWGDFAFTFFESIFSRFIPLYLRDFQCSNLLIGVMTGSFAGMVNILFLPNISQWSDHCRSRWGRRIPFLYVVTPLTVASLVAIGFAPEIANWIHPSVLSGLNIPVSVGMLIIIILCVFVVSFHFFNMVLVNSYNWLLRDVVPQELMARFLSCFRVVGTVSSGLFLWFVFPHVIDHRKEVCVGVGLFYLVSFYLMCRNVKEGEYEPPPGRESRPGILKAFVLYFRECCSIPVYRNFFIAYVLALTASSCTGPFTILFNRETLGLDMDEMGKIFAWAAVVSAAAYLPLGWLCDRYSPLHVAAASLLGQVLGSVCMFFLAQGKTSFLICSMVFSIPLVGWGLACQAMTMQLFPEKKFGQFSSGLNVFGCGALIIGNYLIGQFMDLVHSNYRMTYTWSATLFAISIVPLIFVYRGWKQHGGPQNYVAPMPG